MAALPINFLYLTGIQQQLFSNARLRGSWDASGRYSQDWATTKMTPVTGDDGCPAFAATVALDPASLPPGAEFHWGVLLDGPGASDQWGITTEVNDLNSRERVRSVQFPADGSAGEERYYLNQSRWLGAQKYYVQGESKPRIRFSVWAPNAKKVEVVMTKIWDAKAPDRRPVQTSLERERICGGYIAEDGTGINTQWGPFAMDRQPNGVWATRTDDPELRDFSKFDHRPYMFRVTKDDGSVAYRTDIYSRCQIGFGAFRPDGPYEGTTQELDGSVSSSVVIDPDVVTKCFYEPVWPETQWLSSDDFWKDEWTPDRPTPQRIEDLVIYELHVGALGFGKPDHCPGTLEDAIQLLDYLEDLGVNCVELLPMSEFGGGGGGWGYATSHYFAIEYAGGGRDNYKWFVKECHKRGIAVILDVVYNHYNHNAERAEWMYDSNAHPRNIYYWYEGNPDDYAQFNAAVEPGRRGTGGYLDNLSTGWAPRYYDEMVRKTFVSSAVALAMEFHIDGFRMDQTTSIHAYNALHANGQPVASANAFGQKLLRELTRTLKLVKPGVFLAAEDHSNWDLVTVPADEGGGLGMDATWYADFYHHLIGDTDKGSDYAKLIKTTSFGDDRPLALDYFGGALAATGNHRVVYHESHDEAGNGEFTHRSIVVAVNGAEIDNGNESCNTRRYAEARCRYACGLSMLSAGTPMFLFGEEVGAEKDFLYGKVLENREDLFGMRKGIGKNLFEFFRQAIRTRLAHPGLRSRQIDVIHVHNANRVLGFRRFNEGQELLVLASLNNHPFAAGYVIQNDRIPNGVWKEIFNSDARVFGGDNVGNLGGELSSQEGRFSAVVPANGVVVFEKVG